MKTKCEQEQTLFNDLRHIEKIYKITITKINITKTFKRWNPEGKFGQGARYLDCSSILMDPTPKRNLFRD